MDIYPSGPNENHEPWLWGGSGTCVHLSLPSGVLIFVHNYHSTVFVFLTVTMAMRDMGRASVSQLSGTTQLPPQRTAALVKATLIAPGKSNDWRNSGLKYEIKWSISSLRKMSIERVILCPEASEGSWRNV